MDMIVSSSTPSSLIIFNFGTSKWINNKNLLSKLYFDDISKQTRRNLDRPSGSKRGLLAMSSYPIFLLISQTRS
jgi:hypothetical protein